MAELREEMKIRAYKRQGVNGLRNAPHQSRAVCFASQVCARGPDRHACLLQRQPPAGRHVGLRRLARRPPTTACERPAVARHGPGLGGQVRADLRRRARLRRARGSLPFSPLSQT
eukprot:scaffold86130_cov52-Phaeocystis_antarctica.AAC.3